jgi:peptidyl-prolyl cis-trans isomerase D
MITFFRRLFTSKIGGFLALVLLAFIAVGFALGDLSNVGGFSSGVSTGNVAKVGNRQIGIGELRERIRNAHAQEQRENPTLTLEDFIAQGNAEKVLDGMIEGFALEQYARNMGFTVSKAQVDAQIVTMPQFKGLTGNFEQDKFNQFLTELKISEKELRDDIARSLLVTQLLGPISGIQTMPNEFATRYAELKLESREGQATFIPSSAYAPTADPTEAQLITYYKDNTRKYRIAEQRSIRYAELDLKALAKPEPVTEAEIAAFYKDNAASFAATETRSFSQVIAPDQAAAQKLASAAKSGSLDAAVKAAGLASATVSAANETEFAGSTSPAIAKAAFAAKQGDVIGPMQGSLGWVVLKLEKIDGKPAKSLDQARGELLTVIADRKRQEAGLDAYNKISDSLNGGATVTEVAKTYGLTIITTPLIMANATSLADPAFRVSGDLAKVIPSAFELSGENLGEIVEIAPNERYILAEVAELKAAAPPPLADVKARVIADWKQAEGAKKARDLARSISDAANKSGDIAAATSSSATKNAGVQQIRGVRKDIEAAGQQGKVPPELALLFTMDAKTAKTLELPGNTGWMVIFLNRIIRGDVKTAPDLVIEMKQRMAFEKNNELAQHILEQAKKTLGSSIDKDALAKLKAELIGANAPPAP